MQAVNDILAKLKNKIYHNIYFLHGTESFYIDEITNYIEKNVLNESEKAFNQIVLYGRDIEVQQVLETCSRLPMMSSHQVVIIKEAQDLKNIDTLENYFNKPVSSTILVFAYKHKKIDKRKLIFKNLLKNDKAVVLETIELRDYEIPPWINKYAKSKKVDISPNGVTMLAEFLGNDLKKISHEIEKLVLIKGEGISISEADIEKNIGISKDYNIFELNNALGERNHLKVYKMVQYFIANPKSLPFPLAMSSMYGFFIKLFLLKYTKNFDNNSLASTLKVNPYIVKTYVQYAANYNANQLRNIFELLHEYDLKSKGIGSTGATSEGELIKELTAKILI